MCRSACALFLILGSVAEKADAQTGQPSVWEIVYDGDTVIRLEQAHFTSGTRPLAWLAETAKTTGKKPPAGPEHLEFREENSTSFKDGIVTYVPLPSLLRLEYDHDKKRVRAICVQADGKEVTLVGTTKYAGINKFHVEGTAAAAAVKLPAGPAVVQDGLLKTPIRGIRLRANGPEVKPALPPLDRIVTLIGQDKDKSAHQVTELTALYRVGGGQRVAPVLMFQKVGQLDLRKLRALKQLPPSKKQNIAHDYEVTLADGVKQTLTLLDKTTLDDNQPAQLVGLVGRVSVGWKLFPPHTIASVHLDAGKK
jgi:hypothetical protein